MKYQMNFTTSLDDVTRLHQQRIYGGFIKNMAVTGWK